MGVKQIPLKVFIRFLKKHGIVYIRTESSHDIYDNPKSPLQRPVVVRPKYKDIPMLHIHTNLMNMGLTKKDLENFLKND